MAIDTETLHETPGHLYEGEDPESAIQAPPDSALEELRTLRDEVAADLTKDLPVPGYDGKLVVRYKRVEWETIRRIRGQAIKTARRDKSLDPDVIAAKDLLARACQEIFRRDDTGALIALADPEDEPVRFDDRAAAAVGQSASSARETISAIFVHDPAIILQAQELTVWLGQAEEELDEDFA